MLIMCHTLYHLTCSNTYGADTIFPISIFLQKEMREFKFRVAKYPRLHT